MSLTKAEREKCWNSRDDFWKCLDESKDQKEMCIKFREIYESSCPAQWVKHFDRKREYIKFKDRIQQGPRGTSSTSDPSTTPNPEFGLLLDPTSQHDQSNKSTDLVVPPPSPSSSAVGSPTSSPNTRIYRKFQPQTFS